MLKFSAIHQNVSSSLVKYKHFVKSLALMIILIIVFLEIHAPQTKLFSSSILNVPLFQTSIEFIVFYESKCYSIAAYSLCVIVTLLA